MTNPTALRATVLGLLLAMGVVMALSVRDDSLTTDESLYIPTGYQYLTERNARIGFEHPPLVRDLAALPLLFLDLRPAANFVRSDIRGRLSQAAFEMGDAFVYEQSETPDRILFLARLPMIALALVLGFLLHRWTEACWGPRAALIALVLYVSSPFVLAHGRLVTMDVPSALGAWAALFCFVRFLEKPSPRNIAIFGAVFAGAQLVKFALLAMLPFLAGLLVLWTLLRRAENEPWLGHAARLALGFAAALGVSALVISLVYAFHVWNYPADQHAQDMIDVLSGQRANVYPRFAWLPALTRWRLLRPLAHYLFGVVCIFAARYRYGAFGYFMGEGSETSWPMFHPFGYFAKQPIAFHVLTLLALAQVARELAAGDGARRVLAFARAHFFTVAGVLWIAYYWYILVFISVGNSGSRYLLPSLPFLLMLVAAALARWLAADSPAKTRRGVLVALLLWNAASVATTYPSFLAYFNEAVGGGREGSWYLVDTDCEWGQDAKRLALWVVQHDIPRIKVAQRFRFRLSRSGAEADGWAYSRSYAHYLGARYAPLEPGVEEKGWIAVPARLLRWGQARAAAREGWSSDSFAWLARYQPVAVIGNSIFVYQIR